MIRLLMINLRIDSSGSNNNNSSSTFQKAPSQSLKTNPVMQAEQLTTNSIKPQINPSHTTESFPKYKISVHPPVLKPKITNIGYGNPRYNSMIEYQGNLLVPCGSSLRLVNIKNNEILFHKQIGQSQIFQIEQNSKYILIVNFEGLITLLNKDNLSEVKHSFYAPGKQIRHLSFTDWRLVISCELSELDNYLTKFCIYSLHDIESCTMSKKPIQPRYMVEGHYYFPEETLKNQLIVIEYEDPNPVGRSRTETVLEKKLPIKHRIIKFVEKSLEDQNGQENETLSTDKKSLSHTTVLQLSEKGEIICAVSNGEYIFYLHPARKLSTFCPSTNKIIESTLEGKSIPIVIQKFREGFIWASSSKQFTYAHINKDTETLQFQKLPIDSHGVGGNLSIKPFLGGQSFFLYNENGLHHFCHLENQTFTHNEFEITNCGLSMNHDATLMAVGDFAGNVSILETHGEQHNVFPRPILKANVLMPIRSLVWCSSGNEAKQQSSRNLIVIGCVGGGLWAWNIDSQPEPLLIEQLQHTINILRYAHGRIFVGTSDGQVKIIHQETLTELYKYKAHHPINYETEKQRELFGSMKNYAEIWSLTIGPNKTQQNHITIVSCSEDQTEKIFKVTDHKEHQMLHHLRGHQLAVTSVDWKHMGKCLGEIYVSCSDDKTVRFRDPTNEFKILFELETNTIKEWHTLTYLALEEGGTRVAVGSQNGYLFVFDILRKELLFGEKIHLGGIEGLDWRNKKLCTCSSDLCLSILEFDQ